MRLLFISLLTLSLLNFTEAQPYKVKKNVIYSGKEPVGTLESKLGLLNQMLSIENMEGELQLFMEGEYFHVPDPTYGNILYFNIDFPHTGKKIATYAPNKATWGGKRRFLNTGLKGMGLTLYADGLHADEIEQVKDYSDQIAADTMAILNEIERGKEILTRSIVEREYETAPKMVFLEAERAVKTFSIQSQAYNPSYQLVTVELGRVEEIYKVAEGVVTEAYSHVIIYKRLNSAKEYKGRPTRYYPAAHIDMSPFMSNIYFFQTGETKHASDIVRYSSSKPRQKLNDLINYMLSNGLL